MLLPGIFARHTVPAIGVSPAVLKRADGLLATPRRYRTAFVVRCKSSSTQDSSRAQRPHKRTGKQSTGPAGPRQRASSLQDTSPQQSRKPGYKQRHEQHDHSKCTRGRESSSPQQFRTGQHKVPVVDFVCQPYPAYCRRSLQALTAFLMVGILGKVDLDAGAGNSTMHCLCFT